MSKRILIVDDEPNIRLSYRLTLESDGFGIMEADSGKRALELLTERRFDLAILDMRMPEMDGLELLAAMRQKSLATPVIVATAYGDVPHAVQAMKLGAIDFLQKPLTPETLRNVVHHVLARHAPEPSTHDDFETHIVTAKRLLNLQDFAGAKEHLIRAMELQTNAEALNLAGVLFEMQEDFDLAKKYYGQAVKADKHYEPAQQNLRRLYELFQFGSSQEPIALGDD